MHADLRGVSAITSLEATVRESRARDKECGEENHGVNKVLPLWLLLLERFNLTWPHRKSR